MTYILGIPRPIGFYCENLILTWTVPLKCVLLLVLGLGRISVLTDIRPPESLFRVLTDICYPFFFTDIRFLILLLSVKPLNLNKTYIFYRLKIFILYKSAYLRYFSLSFFSRFFFLDLIFSIFSDDFFFSKKSTNRRITDNG